MCEGNDGWENAAELKGNAAVNVCTLYAAS